MLKEIVVSLFDFRSLPIPEALLQICVKGEAIEEKLQAAAVRFLTIRPVSGPVAEGDIVTLELEGETVRCKAGDARDTTGLAQAVLGRAVDEQLAGGGRITAVKRRFIPELTDAMTADLGLPGVSTIAEYREYLFRKAEDREKQKKLNGIFGLVRKEIMARSTFQPLTKEHPMVAAQLERYLAMARSAAEESGTALYEAGAKLFHGVSCQSDAEFVEKLSAVLEDTVRMAAVGSCLAEQDGVVYTPESVLRDMEETAAQYGVSVERLLSGRTPEQLVFDSYQNYLGQAVTAYYDSRFHTVRE